MFDGRSAHFSGDGFPGMQFKVYSVPPSAVRRLGAGRAGFGPGARRPQPTPQLAQPSSYVKPMTFGDVAPRACSSAIVDAASAAGRRARMLPIANIPGANAEQGGQ